MNIKDPMMGKKVRVNPKAKLSNGLLRSVDRAKRAKGVRVPCSCSPAGFLEIRDSQTDIPRYSPRNDSRDLGHRSERSPPQEP